MTFYKNIHRVVYNLDSTIIFQLVR